MYSPTPSSPAMRGLGSYGAIPYYDSPAGARSAGQDMSVRSSKHYVPGASFARTDPLSLQAAGTPSAKPIRKAVDAMSFQASMNGSSLRPSTAQPSSRREMAAGGANPDQSLRTTASRLFNVDMAAGAATPSRRPASPVAPPSRRWSVAGSGPGGAYLASPTAHARVESIATHIARPESHPEVLQYRYHSASAAAHKLDASRTATPTSAPPAAGACKASYTSATGDYYRNLQHAKSSRVFY